MSFMEYTLFVQGHVDANTPKDKRKPRLNKAERLKWAERLND